MFQKISGLLIIGLLIVNICCSQNVTNQINAGLQNLMRDDQFKHAITSLYVVDSKTGKTIFDQNSEVGLVPASCQKIITSIAAYELLGRSFQYKTYVESDFPAQNGILKGNLYITGSGDPTLGSNRFATTTSTLILKKILNVLQKNNIKSVTGNLVCNDVNFTNDPIPHGWVWEDIGNYYGAGAWGLNWMENQFDVTFKTGKSQHDATKIIAAKPASILTENTFTNFITTGDKGSGDNGYLFSSPYNKNIIARGTVPMSENGFTISGSIPYPPGVFIKNLYQYLKDNGIIINGITIANGEEQLNNKKIYLPQQHIDSILSPNLDSINYWFLKKSVNLYGEALVKTIAHKNTTIGDTETGVSIIQNFYNKIGIEKSEIKIIDGSGLSPANRITTRSLVTALKYAQKQSWFSSFNNALPLMNGIKMKDGYIGGVRSYTGYVQSKTGSAYTFAFIVNNFNGNPGLVREKMYKLLDILK